MDRIKLIKSDSYLQANIDCIVTSDKPVKKTRKELFDFFNKLRDELLLVNNPNYKKC